jgi:hypothetical protein
MSIHTFANFEEGLEKWLNEKAMFPLREYGENLNWTSMKRREWFRIKEMTDEQIEEMYIERNEGG